MPLNNFANTFRGVTVASYCRNERTLRVYGMSFPHYRFYNMYKSFTFSSFINLHIIWQPYVITFYEQSQQGKPYGVYMSWWLLCKWDAYVNSSLQNCFTVNKPVGIMINLDFLNKSQTNDITPRRRLCFRVQLVHSVNLLVTPLRVIITRVISSIVGVVRMHSYITSIVMINHFY